MISFTRPIGSLLLRKSRWLRKGSSPSAGTFAPSQGSFDKCGTADPVVDDGAAWRNFAKFYVEYAALRVGGLLDG